MVPTVLRIVLPSVTMVEMIGAVVMATPVAVAVTVPLTLVMRVVSVTVAAPPFAAAGKCQFVGSLCEDGERIHTASIREGRRDNRDGAGEGRSCSTGTGT